MTAHFEHEEGDIVRLTGRDAEVIRTGWINVGPHSIFVEFDPSSGMLKVETHPRGNEGATPIRTLSVSRAEVESAGGTDFEATNGDDSAPTPRQAEVG